MDEDESLHKLSRDESWERIRSHELGRLVTHVRDIVDIFPVNYAVDHASVVFRTAEGSKLVELTVNDRVVFEVDGFTEADAWSVVIKGRAYVLERSDELNAADGLGLRPWAPTLKRNYVRIVPDEISGRAFDRTEEPDHTAPVEPA